MNELRKSRRVRFSLQRLPSMNEVKLTENTNKATGELVDSLGYRAGNRPRE